MRALTRTKNERVASMRKLWMAVALCLVFMSIGQRSTATPSASFSRIEILGSLVSVLITWLSPPCTTNEYQPTRGLPNGILPIHLICTLLFLLIVFATTFKMLWNIQQLLMESTPREIDVVSLERGLLEM
ncbi:hypothetical protein ACFE04_029820 [Oxalis oulophora]